MVVPKIDGLQWKIPLKFYDWGHPSLGTHYFAYTVCVCVKERTDASTCDKAASKRSARS